jgi:UDP-N-acetylglucosamine 2-epimerase (non-hydrolysing)
MIYLVGGARPNFMKIAAISRAFEKYGIEYEIIHTGQHYNYNMNNVFFKEFGLKEPYSHLDVGSGGHGEQTGLIMKLFEELCINERPEMVVTVGDVNSTLAASLVAAKLHISLAHQEAGMRSFDKKMPEEINRICSDHVSDLLFPISSIDEQHLLEEGIPSYKIFLVGDVMIDNLLYYTKDIEFEETDKHILVELHRPANVDDYDNLKEICSGLRKIADEGYNVVFPMHPRTRKMVNRYDFWGYLRKIKTVEPMGYFEFIKNVKNSNCVITDSDGLQQETSVLDIPCVAIRDTTNIPYTVDYGTTTLCDTNKTLIYDYAKDQLSNPKKQKFSGLLSKLNDGNAAERMTEIIKDFL